MQQPGLESGTIYQQDECYFDWAFLLAYKSSSPMLACFVTRHYRNLEITLYIIARVDSHFFWDKKQDREYYPLRLPTGNCFPYRNIDHPQTFQTFNNISRYLDDFLKINNNHFIYWLNKIYWFPRMYFLSLAVPDIQVLFFFQNLTISWRTFN